MADPLETSPAVQITLLGDTLGRATPRQLRLFATASCRLVWNRMTNVACREAVEVSERFADGLSTLAELDAVRRSAYRARDIGDLAKLAADTAKREAHQAAQMATHIFGYAARDLIDAQHLVFEDIFGNTPFRRMPSGVQRSDLIRDFNIRGFDFQVVPFVSEWRTNDVLGIAEAMYASRDFYGMPVLADALEESGCVDPRILSH